MKKKSTPYSILQGEQERKKDEVMRWFNYTMIKDYWAISPRVIWLILECLLNMNWLQETVDSEV